MGELERELVNSQSVLGNVDVVGIEFYSHKTTPKFHRYLGGGA